MKTSHEADKNIIALLTIAVAFVIFVIFFKNQDFLAESNMTNSYVVVSAIGLGLLMVLVYLINNRQVGHTKKSPSTKTKRR